MANQSKWWILGIPGCPMGNVEKVFKKETMKEVKSFGQIGFDIKGYERRIKQNLKKVDLIKIIQYLRSLITNYLLNGCEKNDSKGNYTKDYGSNEIYKYYTKEVIKELQVDRKLFRKICDEFNKLLIDEIPNGLTVKFVLIMLVKFNQQFYLQQAD